MLRNALIFGLATCCLVSCSEQPEGTVNIMPPQTNKPSVAGADDLKSPAACLLAGFKVRSNNDAIVECSASENMVSLSANGAVYRFPIVELNENSTWFFDEAGATRLSIKSNDFTTIFSLPSGAESQCLTVSAIAKNGVSDSVFFMNEGSSEPVQKNLKIDPTGEPSINNFPLSELVSVGSELLMIYPREIKAGPISIQLNDCPSN